MPTRPAPESIPQELLVVMGVSGSGKTTIAQGLHALLGWPFQEGDALHPAYNVQKMASGTPLTDEDRTPWLAACRAWLEQCSAQKTGAILTCSALKHSYRNFLRNTGLNPLFLYLHTDEEILRSRLLNRQGHYMPAALLPSQLETLEPPTQTERALSIESAPLAATTIADILMRLKHYTP